MGPDEVRGLRYDIMVLRLAVDHSCAKHVLHDLTQMRLANLKNNTVGCTGSMFQKYYGSEVRS